MKYTTHATLLLALCFGGINAAQAMSAPPVVKPGIPDPDQSIVHGFKASATINHPQCNVPRRDIHFKNSDAFSVENSYMLLLATYLTEQDDSLARKQFKAWKFKQTEIWQDKFFGIKALISEHDKFTLVAFRGTTTFQDYVNNVLFALTETKDWVQGQLFEGKINFGYWNVFVATNKRIHEAILRNGGGEKPVFFTGHSRGGNFALLNAIYHQDQGGKVAGIQSWGQPRIGDKAFNDYAAELIGNKYHRVGRQRDITPNVPPTVHVADSLEQSGAIPGLLASAVRGLKYDYTVGRMYVLPDEGTLYESLDQVELETAYFIEQFDNLKDGYLFETLPDFITQLPKNHNPPSYICGLLRQM